MQRITSILGALRGNRFLALAVIVLVLVSAGRVSPMLGIELPFDGVIRNIREAVLKVGSSPPAGEPGETKKGSSETGSGLATTAAKAAGGLAARAARASGEVLNTPTNQWTRLLRNMNIGQSFLLAVIAGFLLRKGALPWLANLTFGQAVAAGQAIDQQARRAPLLQWLIYGPIGLGIGGLLLRSMRQGFENLLTVSLTGILPLLVVAAVFAISPRLKDELNRLVQAAVGIVGPLFDLVRLILLVYFGGSWAAAIPWGDRISVISTAAVGQPRPVSTALDVATVGVRLANSLIINEYVGYAGLLLFAIWAAREVIPARRIVP